MGTWIEILERLSISPAVFVVPYVGTWIEIDVYDYHHRSESVVPYVGTWIEIVNAGAGTGAGAVSFPTWERG